jgi:hypothetical protein
MSTFRAATRVTLSVGRAQHEVLNEQRNVLAFLKRRTQRLQSEVNISH